MRDKSLSAFFIYSCSNLNAQAHHATIARPTGMIFICGGVSRGRGREIMFQKFCKRFRKEAAGGTVRRTLQDSRVRDNGSFGHGGEQTSTVMA